MDSFYYTGRLSYCWLREKSALLLFIIFMRQQQSRIGEVATAKQQTSKPAKISHRYTTLFIWNLIICEHCTHIRYNIHKTSFVYIIVILIIVIIIIIVFALYRQWYVCGMLNVRCRTTTTCLCVCVCSFIQTP